MEEEEEEEEEEAAAVARVVRTERPMEEEASARAAVVVGANMRRGRRCLAANINDRGQRACHRALLPPLSRGSVLAVYLSLQLFFWHSSTPKPLIRDDGVFLNIIIRRLSLFTNLNSSQHFPPPSPPHIRCRQRGLYYTTALIFLMKYS